MGRKHRSECTVQQVPQQSVMYLVLLFRIPGASVSYSFCGSAINVQGLKASEVEMIW